jgi:hypothetical protein
LIGTVHSHRKTEKFLLTTRDVWCVHHGWHGTHRYSSLLQWSMPLGQWGHVAMVGRIPGLWHIPKEKYVSYGFPIVNFCNPGEHYEMPCIMAGDCSRWSDESAVVYSVWTYAYIYMLRGL